MVLGDWLYPLFIGACVVVAAVAAYFGWRPERPGGEAEPAEPTAVPLPVVVPGSLPDKQMGKSRIGGLALLALLVVAYFIGQSGDSKTTSTSSGSQQPTETYRTTAGQLFDQYAANEVATDRGTERKDRRNQRHGSRHYQRRLGLSARWLANKQPIYASEYAGRRRARG
jgi:hypothetical protein